MFGLGKNTLLVNNSVSVLFITLLSFNTMSTVAYGLNLAPDCSQATAIPNLIIPPDNRMVPIQINGVIDPENLPVTIEAQCIMQDEPVEYWRWYNIFKDDDETHDIFEDFGDVGFTDQPNEEKPVALNQDAQETLENKESVTCEGCGFTISKDFRSKNCPICSKKLL